MKTINLVTKSVPFEQQFIELNDIHIRSLIVPGYDFSNCEGVKLTGVMDLCPHEKQPGLAIHTSPLTGPVETIHVSAARLTKSKQTTVLDDAVNYLGLDFIIPKIVMLSDKTRFVSKPELGANSHDVFLGVGLSDLKRHHAEREGDTGELKPYEYIPDVVAEYRLMPVPGWEDCGYRRSLVTREDGLTVPRVIDDDEYDLTQLDIPTDVLQQVLLLVNELDIWGYSIDLFKTSTGKWGIWEYSPEYGVRKIPHHQAVQLRTLTVQYYLDTAFERGPVEIDYASRYFRYKPLVRRPNLEGSFIRALRLDKGWDIHIGAKEIGISSARLSEIESGHRPVTEPTMMKLTKCFGVTRTDLTTPPPCTGILDDIVRHMSSLERRRFEIYLTSTMLPQDQRRCRMAVAKDRNRTLKAFKNTFIPNTGEYYKEEMAPESKGTMQLKSIFDDE